MWQYYIFIIGFMCHKLALFYIRNKQVNPYIKLQIVWRFTITTLIYYTIYKDKSQLLIGYSN